MVSPPRSGSGDAMPLHPLECFLTLSHDWDEKFPIMNCFLCIAATSLRLLVDAKGFVNGQSFGILVAYTTPRGHMMCSSAPAAHNFVLTLGRLVKSIESRSRAANRASSTTLVGALIGMPSKSRRLAKNPLSGGSIVSIAGVNRPMSQGNWPVLLSRFVLVPHALEKEPQVVRIDRK